MQNNYRKTTVQFQNGNGKTELLDESERSIEMGPTIECKIFCLNRTMSLMLMECYFE